MRGSAASSAAVLDAQREQWERALEERADRFGAEASAPARAAAEAFARAGARRLLELGGGQGRDTLFFAELGYVVDVLDYAASAVDTITRKASEAGLAGRISAARHDVRQPLPYPDESFDACYSHMLFCMALTEGELRQLLQEICRLLRPGGLCVYTVRTTRDPDYGKGVHHGEGLYELGGFIVHFFTGETVERRAEGYEIVEVAEFEEGALPRRLYRVTLRKPTGDRGNQDLSPTRLAGAFVVSLTSSERAEPSITRTDAT